MTQKTMAVGEMIVVQAREKNLFDKLQKGARMMTSDVAKTVTAPMNDMLGNTRLVAARVSAS